jgi:hypothetical protein
MSEGYKNDFQSDTPHTDNNATPVNFDQVDGARVVHVFDGEYRSAKLTGTFQVAVNQGPLTAESEAFYAECYWFGCRPGMSWPLIRLVSRCWREEKNYNGPVIRNIGRLKSE